VIIDVILINNIYFNGKGGKEGYII